MALAILNVLPVTAHLSWLIGALNSDETTSFLSLGAPGVVRYSDGGGEDTLPQRVPAINGSDKTFDRTEAVWVGYTVRASNVLSVCREVDLPTLDGDIAPLCRIDRHTVRPYQPGGFTTTGGGVDLPPVEPDPIDTDAEGHEGKGGPDYPLDTAGTWYGSTHVTVPAGFWHITLIAGIESDDGGATITVRLTDGSSHLFAEGVQTAPAAGGDFQVEALGMAWTYDSSTLLTLQVKSDIDAGGTLKGAFTRIEMFKIKPADSMPPPTWINPLNGDTEVILRPLMRWTADGPAIGWHLTVSTHSDFSSPLYDLDLTAAEYLPTSDLAEGTLYYARVRATDGVFTTSYASISFTTLTIHYPIVWIGNGVASTVSAIDFTGQYLGEILPFDGSASPLTVLIVGSVVWIVKFTGAAIQQLNPDGTSAGADITNADFAGNPTDVAAVGSEYWVPLFHGGGDRIVRLNADGTSAGSYYSGNGLNFPWSLAVVGSTVWVSNNNNTVSLFDFSGGSAGSPLSGNGLNIPKAVRVIDTLVWVLNNGNNTISLFNTDGTSAGSPLSGNGLDNPQEMCIVDDEVWVINAAGYTVNQGTVSRFNFDGTSAGGVYGPFPAFAGPQGIGVAKVTA